MKPSANTIFIILTAIIVAAAAYWYLIQGNPTDQTLTVDVIQSPAEAEFQTLVTELQPVTFTTTIFSDPEFKVLKDLTADVAPETTGRTDPFAPVAGVSAQP